MDLENYYISQKLWFATRPLTFAHVFQGSMSSLQIGIELLCSDLAYVMQWQTMSKRGMFSTDQVFLVCWQWKSYHDSYSIVTQWCMIDLNHLSFLKVVAYYLSGSLLKCYMHRYAVPPLSVIKCTWVVPFDTVSTSQRAAQVKLKWPVL